MKKISIDNAVDIAKKMNKCKGEYFDESIVAVGYYETVVEIMNYLIKNTSAEFVSGELNEPEWDGYDEAYYVELYGDEIYVGKSAAIGKDKAGKEVVAYICYESREVFVEEDFLEPYLKNNSDDNVVVFSFTKEEEETNGMYVFKDKDNKGFTYCGCSDGGYYRYTYRGIDKLSEEDIKKILNRFVFC